jgi:hypothetical protein
LGALCRLTRRSSPSGITSVSDSTCATIGAPSGPATFAATLSATVRGQAASAAASAGGATRNATLAQDALACTSSWSRSGSSRSTRSSLAGS